MQKTKIIFQVCYDKQTRAYTELRKYLNENGEKLGINSLTIEDVDFCVLRGILYSFFERHSIIVSVNPRSIDLDEGKVKCDWSYLIHLEGAEVMEHEFKDREVAEFVAFTRAFQFLDTTLFMQYSKDRFFDESADSSCLNVNWEQLNRVLSHKRRNISF